MSGGYFEYNQYKIEYMADQIEHLIETNDCTDKDILGYDIGNHYPKDIIEKFELAAKTLRKAATMVQRIDWLVSGDDCEDSFLKRWAKEVSEDE